MQIYPSTDREIRQHVIFQKLAAVRMARIQGARVTLQGAGEQIGGASRPARISPGIYSPCDGLGGPQRLDLQ
jgi:hypothetical protein